MVDERRKKKVDEVIQRLKNADCAWPGCKEKSIMTVGVPIAKQEGTNINFSKSESLTMPMCMFHMMCLEKVPVGIMIDEKEQKHKLVGHFGIVNIIEDVIHAAVSSGRMRILFKEKEKIDKEVEETKSKKEDEPNVRPEMR